MTSLFLTFESLISLVKNNIKTNSLGIFVGKTCVKNFGFHICLTCYDFCLERYETVFISHALTNQKQYIIDTGIKKYLVIDDDQYNQFITLIEDYYGETIEELTFGKFIR